MGAVVGDSHTAICVLPHVDPVDPGADEVLSETLTTDGVPSVACGSADPAPEAPNRRPWVPTVLVVLLVVTALFGRSATQSGDAGGLVEESSTGDATAAGGSERYTVQRGDTVSGIAAQLGIDAEVLLAANGISDPNRIEAGQLLLVPVRNVAVGMTCPVPGGEFLPEFGYIKPNGKFHAGVDIYAPAETAVLAPIGGSVRFEEGTIGGLQFTIRGDDGVSFVGTHLASFGPNAEVSAGDVVGYVGNSGNAVGGPAHLHFEILVGGEPVDPFATLDAAC